MATVPTIPIIYKKTSVYDSTAVFYWRPPSSDGGSSITSYWLECDTIPFSQNIPSTIYYYRVQGLTNGNSYKFTIKATNSIGNSNIATFDSFIPGIKPDPPYNIFPNVLANVTSFDWNNQYYGWSPSNIGNVSLWIDLYDTNTYTTNGSNLISIIDKSPSNNTISISNIRPSFNSRLVNNRPGITFNGNNWLRGNFSETFTGNTYSVFVVASMNSTTPNDGRLVSFSNIGNVDTASTTVAPITRWSNTSNFVASKNATAYASSGISYSTNMVYKATYDGVQFKNGTNGSSITAALAANLIINNWGIGYQADYGGTNLTTYWNGNFCEIIVYLKKLTSIEQQLLEGYLSWKWNINSSLTSTHLYKSTSPNNLFSLFNPGLIPNCQLWLDGSDSNNFILDQNGNITTWLDKSSYRNHFNGNGQKLVDFNSSKKTVNFPTGNIGYMTSTKTYNYTQNSTELFIVAQFTKGLTASATLFGTHLKVLNFSNGTLIGSPGGAGGNEAEYSGNGSRINASTASANATTYTNYFLVNARAGTNWGGSVTDVIAHLGYNPSYNNGAWIGNISEVIAYSSINTDNYTILQGYLAWKWGINLLIPTTHEYYNFNPDLGDGFKLGLHRNIITVYPKSITGNILTNNPDIIRKLNTFGNNFNGTLTINDPSYSSYVVSVKSTSNIGHSSERYSSIKFHPNIPTNGLKLWLDPFDTSTMNMSNNYVLTWNDNSLNQSNANITNPLFFPSNVANLSLWFDSSDLSTMTISSNIVTQWKDKSNISANFVLAPHNIYTGPTYSNRGLLFNNFNTNLVTAGQAGLRLNSNITLANTNKVFYVVYNNNRLTTQNYNDVLQLISVGIAGYHFDLGISDGAYGPWVSNSTLSIFPTATGWSTANLFTIVGAFFSPTRVDLRVNGTLYIGPTQPTFNIQNRTFDRFTVGGHIDNRNFTGNIAEILIYDGLTSNDTLEYQKIETYLSGKWNLQPNIEPVKLLDITRTLSPNDIPNILLWLDGNDPLNNNTKPSNGSSVTIWYDKSGNQNNAIRYSTNGVPTFNSSTNGISFNNQMYVLTYPISQIGTIFIVGKQNASNGNMMTGQADDLTGYSPYYIAIKSDTSLTVSKPGETLVNFQVLPSSFNTITLFTGQITSSLVSATLNGGQNIVSQSYTGSLKKATETYIGASWFNNVVSIANASEIYEIIVFSYALTSNQTQQIEGYLANKWKLKNNLPSTHSLKVGTPITKLGPEPTYDSANGLISFNGNQYLTLPPNTIPSANTDYTMFIYCSAFNPSTSQYLLYSGTPRPNNSLNILLNQSNIFNSWDTNQILGNNFIVGNTNIIAELTFSQGRRNTFINGYLVASDITPTRSSTSANNFIGTASNLTSNLVGKIGDIIIYDRLLSTTERDLVRSFISSRRNHVAQQNTGNLVVWLDEKNFTGGNLWLDKSLNRYNSVLELGNSNINSFNNGIILDGRSSWRFPQTGNLDITKSYSISIWFKKTGNIDEGASLITQESSNITNFSVTGNFSLANIGNNVIGITYNNGTSGYVTNNYTIDFPNYIWKNVTFTYGGNPIRTYVNGIEENYFNWNQFALSTINSYYVIGKSWNANNYIRGELGEIVLYNRELSSSEVLQNYNFSKSNYEFSPLSIGGLQLWLDASDLSTLTITGSEVPEWRDKSGFNRHATKKESNNPTYSANGFNNRPTINFSYGLAYQCPMPAGTTNKFMTTFVVYKKTSTAIGDDGLISRTMDPPNGHLPAPIDIRREQRIFDSGVTILSTDFNVQTQRYNNIFSFFVKSGVYEEYNNGQIINYTNTATANYSDSSANYIYIGTRGDNGVRLNGSISEVLVYNTELTTQERQMIEGYLAWKWGLQSNLLSSHPYKNNYPYLYNKNPIFSGCKLWLDANDYSTFSFNGSNITQWRDKSPEQNHMNANIGNAILTVDSNINVLSISNGTILTSLKNLNYTYYTKLFAVVKNMNPSSSMMFNFIDTGPNYTIRYEGNLLKGGPDSSSVFNSSYRDINGNSAYVNASRDTGLSSRYSDYHLLDMSFNIGDGSSRIQISTDYFVNGTQNYFIGNIAEIMIFENINSTNLQNVQGYLANKWNLTSLIPTSHPFKSTNPYPSNTFLPSHINSLVAWYDAYDRNNMISISKTNLITRWNDRSGNNNHATANISIAPIYDSTRRAVSFTNGKFFDINVPYSSNLSMFIVCTRSTTSAYYLARSTVTGNGPTLRSNYTSTNFEFFDNTNSSVINSAPSTSEPFIAGFTFKAGQKVNGYYNSTNVFTINQTNTTSNANYNYIGYNNLNAYIYEILIYNTVLRNTEVAAITSYLKNKWSLNF